MPHTVKTGLTDAETMVEWVAEDFDPNSKKHVRALFAQKEDDLRSFFKRIIKAFIQEFLELRRKWGFIQGMINIAGLNAEGGDNGSETPICKALQLITALANEVAEELSQGSNEDRRQEKMRLNCAYVHGTRPEGNFGKFKNMSNEDIIGATRHGTVDVIIAYKKVDTGFNCPLIKVSDR